LLEGGATVLQTIRSFAFDSSLPLLAAGLLLVSASCAPGGGSAPSHAQQVFEKLTDQDPSYAEFAFSLLADYREDPFAVQRIVEALESDNAARERLALRALGEGAPPPEAVAPLRQVFEKRSGTLKLQAALALADGGDEEALGWVRELGQAQGDTLSDDALRVLAQHGSADLVGPILKRRTQSDQIGVRNEAYAVLGSIGEPWATQMLVEGLSHEFGEERAQAVTSLGQTGDPAVAAQLEKLVGFQGLVLPTIEALGRLGNPSSVKVLERMAKHEQPLVRAYAGPALCRLGVEEPCAKAVEPLLEEGDPLVRRELAEQLAGVDAPAAFDWLGRLAHDEDVEVRAEAVRSLLARNPASAEPIAPLLLELATDPDYRVSTLALGGLARFGGEESLAELEPLLENENPYVALAAARAVGAIETRTG